MKFVKTLLLLFLLVPLSIFAQVDQNKKKVLLVGNSFTYFWNMPQMVNAMAELDNYPMQVYQSTVGGSTWEEHYNEKRDTKTRSLLKTQEWDYVILQNHSASAIEAPEKFEEFGTKLAQTITDAGAKPYLMTTWAYLSNPLMQETISRKYNELATKIKSEAIPAGEIFMKGRNLRPDLNFYFDDKHPSSDGSYLLALIIYKALTGNAVKDIPDRLYSKDKDGEVIILSFILPETGNFLRQLVDQTDFNKSLIE